MKDLRTNKFLNPSIVVFHQPCLACRNYISSTVLTLGIAVPLNLPIHQLIKVCVWSCNIQTLLLAGKSFCSIPFRTYSKLLHLTMLTFDIFFGKYLKESFQIHAAPAKTENPQLTFFSLAFPFYS